MRRLTEEEGRLGLKLAREAIEKYVRGGVKIKPPSDLPEIFNEKSGVFVTINKHHALRGCIGYPYPILPLKEAIIDSAINAAVNDPRFPPLSERELDEIELELTILTPPQRLKAKPKDLPKLVEVGRHGLIVKRGIYQGLLLPQVAVEYGWDAEEFLCQTCVKAGLPPDAWLDENTEVSIFEGQIFKERR